MEHIMNKAKLMLLAFATVFLVAACTPDTSPGTTSGTGGSLTTAAGTGGGTQAAKPTIRVGTKDFTESLIVGEIYALALEEAGYPVERVPNIAGSIIHTAIINDEIDLYPEYTGTGLLSILKEPLLTDPAEVYQKVKEGYEQFDLTWLDYSEANDGQGLVIRTETARRLGITTISDLQANAGEIRFASQGEFDLREDGIPALEATYGPFDWKSSTLYDNALKYQVLKNDEADVAPAYTTEGQLVNTEDFTLLEDDKRVWPPYNLAPVVQDDVLEANPDITDILNRVSAALTTENITQLNARVDVEQEEYAEVARDFFDNME